MWKSRGEALGERQYLLDNRTRNGVAGYHVHVPMLVTGLDRLMLVNRGWVEVGRSRERRPDVSLTSSEIVISGVVEYPRRTLLLGDDGYARSTWPKVVQRIDLEKTARDLDRQVLPFVVLMDAEHPHGFVREWTPYLGIGPERHRGLRSPVVLAGGRGGRRVDRPQGPWCAATLNRAGERGGETGWPSWGSSRCSWFRS